jgi:hypothetical protein
MGERLAIRFAHYRVSGGMMCDLLLHYRQSGSNPEMPVKSDFEQVHWVSEFGGLNLVKTPFFLHFDANFGVVVLQDYFRVVDNTSNGRELDLVEPN